MTVPTTRQNQSGSGHRLGLMLGAAVALTGCARTEQIETADAAGAADARTVDQVTDRMEDYLGQRITVRGTMEKVRSLRSFVLEDHDWLFKEELLVIAPDQPATTAPAADLEGTKMTATGTLRRMVVSEVEREYDLDLDPEFELEISNRPVLVAEELRPDPTAGATTEGTGEVTDVLVLVPIPGPSDLVGDRARLSEVEIQSRAGEHGFWVGPSHTEQVFVRVADSVTGAGVDTLGRRDRVTVVGTVKRVPDREAVQGKWGLDSAQAAIVARREALYVEADTIISPRG